jgi:hypothetical protein
MDEDWSRRVSKSRSSTIDERCFCEMNWRISGDRSVSGNCKVEARARGRDVEVLETPCDEGALTVTGAGAEPKSTLFDGEAGLPPSSGPQLDPDRPLQVTLDQ